MLDDGSTLPAQQKVGGGPSVLYDAVAVLASSEGAAELSTQPAAKDFVTDAHAHCKVIAYVETARPLFDAAGLSDMFDSGYIDIGKGSSAKTFIETCRAGRVWDRAGAA